MKDFRKASWTSPHIHSTRKSLRNQSNYNRVVVTKIGSELATETHCGMNNIANI